HPALHSFPTRRSSDLLSRGLQRLGLVGRIRDVGESLAVDLLQDLSQVGLDRIGVAPGEVRQGLGKRSALLLVEVAHREEDPGQRSEEHTSELQSLAYL